MIKLKSRAVRVKSHFRKLRSGKICYIKSYLRFIPTHIPKEAENEELMHCTQRKLF